MSKITEIMDRISEVIDMKCEYKIVRRPYDKAFYDAHNVNEVDVTTQTYIPCVQCGTDIVPRLLLQKHKTGKAIIFCSKECRTKNALLRLTKFSEDTNIKEMATILTKACLDVDITNDVTEIKKRTTPMVIRKLLSEHNRLQQITNDLLSKLLEVIQHGNRPA